MTNENVAILQSIVTVIALLFGMYVAWSGLSTWKEQMYAKANYDLARRILIAVYKVRNAILNARLDAKLFKTDDVKKNTWDDLERKQLELVKIETTALEIELPEAEVMWGSEIILLCRGVIRLHHEILNAFYIYRNLDDYNLVRPETLENIIFYNLDLKGQDEFANKLKDLVNKIEELLRPKLILRNEKSRKR